MTVVLVTIGIAILSMPRWMSPLTRRLDPREAVRMCVGAVVLGAILVEVSLILFAVPVISHALGLKSLSVSCHFLSDLTPGGLPVGWLIAVLAAALPVLVRRGWLRANAVTEAMRAEPSLGSHRSYNGIDLVQLPTESLIAYSIGTPDPQIVVSDGLASLLSPDEFEAVVSHEAAHVHDDHGRMLRILAALETPVPSLRWITTSVRVAMERCADESAVRHDPAKRMALLDALLKVSDAHVPDSIAAFTQRSGVVERAHALLASPPAPTGLQRVLARVTVSGAAAGSVVLLAGWAFEAHMLMTMSGLCCK